MLLNMFIRSPWARAPRSIHWQWSKSYWRGFMV